MSIRIDGRNGYRYYILDPQDVALNAIDQGVFYHLLLADTANIGTY